MLVVQDYVIKREEKYLARKFGNEYMDYRTMEIEKIIFFRNYLFSYCNRIS
jgi:protein-S-isoprenylcysteine O-methyltransferase Ste14